jgi:hypothetical protein
LRAGEVDEGQRVSNQVVGNAGLYYVCYELSRLRWNVLPTSRNAKGVDLVVYDQTASRTHTIQIKALSKATPVPLGGNLDNLFAEYLVVVRKVLSPSPEVFVAKIDGRVRRAVHVGVNEAGTKSYWLQPKQYQLFSKSLEQVIGRG